MEGVMRGGVEAGCGSDLDLIPSRSWPWRAMRRGGWN